MELIIKKCLKCGAVVKVIEDCECSDCGVMCCNEKMVELKANSVDASVEKHKPEYKIENDELVVTVNHVMESDHYIEWICLVTDNSEEYVYLKPGVNAEARFNNSKGKIYSYCNKHGLWMTKIE